MNRRSLDPRLLEGIKINALGDKKYYTIFQGSAAAQLSPWKYNKILRLCLKEMENIIYI